MSVSFLNLAALVLKSTQENRVFGGQGLDWLSAGKNQSVQYHFTCILVLLLGIFRRAPRPSDTRGRPCALLLYFLKIYW
jgi:hypothetical protein